MNFKSVMRTERSLFILLFITALIARLLFSFYFQQFYFGKFEFRLGDGATYLDPIVNLINYGEYRGDLFLDDSRYFRPPVYPFLLGVLYLLSPAAMLDYFVAAIQCIIGAISTLMVYHVFFNILKIRTIALVAAMLFLLYPFVILWTPLMYTETVQLFLMLSLMYFATIGRISFPLTIIQGILVALIFLTKQYLALILILPLYIIIFAPVFAFRQRIIHLFLLMFSFALVLTPWIIRNYFSSGSVIVFFGNTSGLRNSLDDAVAFVKFANKFDENITDYGKAVVGSGTVRFTKHPNFLNVHEKDITIATQLAFRCGGSFQERRTPSSPREPLPYQNCNQEVVQKFDALSAMFWQEVPIWEALETRRDALWKVISKSELVNDKLGIEKRSLLIYALFKYRVFLLILGFFGILYVLLNRSSQDQQKILAASFLVTAMAFYSFFCLILVQTEMRYLLTPDLLISLFAGVVPVAFFNKILSLRKIGKIEGAK